MPITKQLIALSVALSVSFWTGTAVAGNPVNPRVKGVYSQYDESSVVPPAKAPDGYKLVYLTHYGRHGARYIENNAGYEKVRLPLEKAETGRNLTPAGDSLLADYRALYKEAINHPGELTDLGQTQHRGIASRMVASHRPLFRNGARVEVRSTNLERTMLSMAAFCNAMQSMSPGLIIHADASVSQIHTINPHSVDSRHISSFDLKCRHRSFYDDYVKFGPANVPSNAVAGRLFKDVAATGMTATEILDFVNALYTVACAAEGMDTPQADYFHYFTAGELDALARWDNLFYYLAKGPGYAASQRNWMLSKYILEDIIDRAEEDMADGVSARLRFGHDGCMMALFCLIGIDGWSTVAGSPDAVWDVWDVSRVPMASNIQIDFWKNRRGDVIIQPRYNERPLKLPIEEFAPGFYSWESFKKHYTAVLEQATALLDRTASIE